MISIPLNLRTIIAVAVTLTAVMIAYVQLNSKEKIEYDKITGQIIYLEQQLGQWPTRDLGKYRYLKVAGYEYPFEIFIGDESGDFKPKFEKIDQLKLGDTVTVFYYQTENTMNEQLNRFIQFIDKNDSSYFERGDSSKTLAAVVICICMLMTIGGFILWKMKKISL